MELLSKKMARFIVENSHYFQGTGIYVSEFLNENARKQRKSMREEMLKARKNGQYAVIKENKLYINGKRLPIREETTIGRTLHRNNAKTNEQMINHEDTLTASQQYQPNNNEYNKNDTFRSYRTTI